MKSQVIKVLGLLAAAGALVLFVEHGAAAHSADWDSGRRLEGTWVVTVTQHNCGTGVQLGLPFESLLTFAQGGTLTETTANPSFFPAFRGPGHGVWGKTGGQTYGASSLAFITVNGSLVKTQKITQTIEIGDDPNAFTTTAASVQFYDLAGNLLVTGCATATGKRFE